MFRVLLFVVFLFVSSTTSGQCTIAAKRVACVNDLVNFSINNSSGTISSWDWNFGSYGNSSNTSPIVKFTSQGTVLVKCTLTLAGGGQCIDTHTIVILPNPKALSAMDVGSDSCNKSNRICIKNLMQKASQGLYSLTLLWGDGNIDNYKVPFSSSWCHKYTDTGTYTQSFELADSAGCKDVFKIKVHIVPTPKASVSSTVAFGCDSSKICFNATASGGKNISYSWQLSPSLYTTGSGTPYCVWTPRGNAASVRMIATNDKGCKDTILADTIAPDSGIRFYVNKTYCSNQLQAGISIHSNKPGLWEYNGQSLGTVSFVNLQSAKPGWNVLKVTIKNPCPMTYVDSFKMSFLSVKARLYNEFRRKAEDTAWYIDLSNNPPGSRISRIWSFGDASAAQCTTWTAKNQFVLTNCNHSRDSIASHYYKNKLCYYAQLTLYDSATGCYADTILQPARTDYCIPLISKKIICLDEYEVFYISKPLKRKIKDMNFLLTDTGKNADTLFFYGTQLGYKYKTWGYKSPVFWRYYDPDTVWTERNGKIIIDYIRPAKGWVADTFLNGILVKYKPNAEFTLKKLSDCNPNSVQLTFKEPSWLYPNKMEIQWGDTTIKYTGYTDTIAKLPVLTHTYKKPGRYIILVALTPNGGCVGAFIKEISFGYFDTFTFKLGCSNLICFKDTVRDYDFKNQWTAANKLGQLYWDFGDGKKDSGFNKCHKYDSAGSYIVKLNAISKNGCISTFSRNVTFSKVTAGIKYQPTIFCSETRQYYDSSRILGPPDTIIIKKWTWNFNDGSGTYYIANPAHMFPGGGVYTARLIVTTNQGCSDTAYRIFTVLGPQVKASIISDSIGCAPLKVIFANGSIQTENFIWEYGDSNNTFYSTQKDTNVWFKYAKPGVYYVHLTGGGSFYNPITGNKYYCSVTYPAPDQKQLRITVLQGYYSSFTAPDTLCLGDSLVFDNTSDTANTFNYVWNMGDGNVMNKKNVDFGYIYRKEGTFNVSLHANAPAGSKCVDTARQNVTVLNFIPSFEKDCNKSRAPILYFNNTAGPDAPNYKWTLLNPFDSTETFLAQGHDLRYDFGFDTGARTICLQLNTPGFCKAKTCKTILLKGGIYLANVFTPGAVDGYNDTYKVPLYGYEDYDLRIFNRWGELLFHSNEPSYQWNGKVNNTGLELPSATYFYQLTYRDYCDKQVKTLNGSVNLIR